MSDGVQRFHPRSEAEESEALILWRAHLHDEQYRSGIACRLHFFAMEYQRESEETERRNLRRLFGRSECKEDCSQSRITDEDER